MGKSGVLMGGDTPGLNAKAVTPSSTADLQPSARALWIGGAGNLDVVMAGESDPAVVVTFLTVPASVWMPIQVRRVMATTTCTAIVAVY